MRAFLITAKDADRESLFDYLADTARDFYADKLPEADRDKCIFCPYKTTCEEAE
jgi:CRISPR/Cas system-associated exonuclease Cas4 (RecB family)